MRPSDRYIATGIAVVVWLLVGYALASGPLAPQAFQGPVEATAAVLTPAQP